MVKKVRLNPPNELNQTWANELFERVGEGPLLIQGYDVANLPTATDWGNSGTTNPFSSLIFIRDETGGAVIAFSDGTNWRRVTDRAIVS